MNNNRNKRDRTGEALPRKVRECGDSGARIVPPEEKKKRSKTVSEYPTLKENGNRADECNRKLLPLVHVYSTERVVTKRKRKKVEARTKAESFGQYSNPEERFNVNSQIEKDDGRNGDKDSSEEVRNDGATSSKEEGEEGASNLKFRQEEQVLRDGSCNDRKENEKLSGKYSKLGRTECVEAEQGPVVDGSIGSVGDSIDSFSIDGDKTEVNSTLGTGFMGAVEKDGTGEEDETLLEWTVPPENLTLSDRMHLSFGLCFGHLLQDKSVPNFVFRGMEALKFTLLFYAEKQEEIIGQKQRGDFLSLENISLIADIEWSEAKQNAWVKLFPFDPSFRTAIKKRVDACVISHRESNMKLRNNGNKSMLLTKPALWKNFRTRIVDGFLIVSIMKLFGYGSVCDIESLLKEHGEGMSRRTLFEAYCMWASWNGENRLSDVSKLEESYYKSDSENVYGEIMKLIDSMPTDATSKPTSLENALRKKKRTIDWMNIEKFDSDCLYLALLAASGVRSQNRPNGTQAVAASPEFCSLLEPKRQVTVNVDGKEGQDTSYRLEDEGKPAAIDMLLVNQQSVVVGTGNADENGGVDDSKIQDVATANPVNGDKKYTGGYGGKNDACINFEDASHNGNLQSGDDWFGNVNGRCDIVFDSRIEDSSGKSVSEVSCDDSSRHSCGSMLAAKKNNDGDLSYCNSTTSDAACGINEDDNDDGDFLYNTDSERSKSFTEEVKLINTNIEAIRNNGANDSGDMLSNKRITRANTRSMRKKIDGEESAKIVKPATIVTKLTGRRKTGVRKRSASTKRSKPLAKLSVGDNMARKKSDTEMSMENVVPLISTQLTRKSYNVCLVAEDCHVIDSPAKKVFCHPEPNTKRLILVELASCMMMTMADSSRMAHGIMSSDDAFGLLSRKTNELSPDGLKLPLLRTVQCSTFLVKGGGEINGTGPIQVIYGSSPVYAKYFGKLRLDLKVLTRYLLSLKSDGLRKHSCTFGFQSYNYDWADHQSILTKPGFKSMANLGEVVRICTSSILDAMQLCLDEVIFPHEKVFNNVVRTDFVRKRILEVEPQLLHSRFEGWTWVLTTPAIPLDRHRDEKNCDEQGYAGNCVFSCVYEDDAGLSYRLSLVGFSRKAVGTVVRKLYGYAYDLSDRLNALINTCGNYIDFAVMEKDQWCWLCPDTSQISVHGGKVRSRISGIFKEAHCGLSAPATLIRRASERLFLQIDQRVALLYVACIVGSIGKFWAVVSSWLLDLDYRTTGKMSSGAIVELFWKTMDKWNWNDTDNGLSVSHGWTKVGNWRCTTEEEGTARILALKDVLRNASDSNFDSKKVLDIATKTVAGFEHACVANRFFSLAVLSGIQVSGPFNCRALNCDDRKEALHYSVLAEKGCNTLINQRQFVHAVSKTFNLPRCDAANLILLGATASHVDCQLIIFYGQDLFNITETGVVERKEWNSCSWQELNEV